MNCTPQQDAAVAALERIGIEQEAGQATLTPQAIHVTPEASLTPQATTSGAAETSSVAKPQPEEDDGKIKVIILHVLTVLTNWWGWTTKSPHFLAYNDVQSKNDDPCNVTTEVKETHVSLEIVVKQQELPKKIKKMVRIDSVVSGQVVQIENYPFFSCRM